MRIIHVKSAGVLPVDVRRRLEQFSYPDVNTAMSDLKLHFPNHVVSARDGFIQVTNRDGSVNVALFKEDASLPGRIETNFG